MRNDVTIVSALFNIERERMDGRDWEEYLKWFDVTLQLKCPMVLFITEDVKELVVPKCPQLIFLNILHGIYPFRKCSGPRMSTPSIDLLVNSITSA